VNFGRKIAANTTCALSIVSAASRLGSAMGNSGSIITPRSLAAPVEKRATAIYVSPSGNDSNAGTLAAPLKSIQTAINKLVVFSCDIPT
jgi:hypothetical protein